MELDQTQLHFSERINKLKHDARTSLDNSLLRVSSLGIPLTIAIRDKGLFVGGDRFEWLFILFVACWTITVVSTLVSFRSSEKAWEDTEKNVATKEYRDSSIFSRVALCNHLSFWSFLLGLASLVFFVVSNSVWSDEFWSS